MSQKFCMCKFDTFLSKMGLFFFGPGCVLSPACRATEPWKGLDKCFPGEYFKEMRESCSGSHAWNWVKSHIQADMLDHIHTYCQPLVIGLLPVSSSRSYITRMKEQLMGWNHEEPTIAKHFKGHCFSNLTIIFSAHLYGGETFGLKNQLCCKRNGEVGDKKRGHIYIIKILLKRKNEFSVDLQWVDVLERKWFFFNPG